MTIFIHMLIYTYKLHGGIYVYIYIINYYKLNSNIEIVYCRLKNYIIEKLEDLKREKFIKLWEFKRYTKYGAIIAYINN